MRYEQKLLILSGEGKGMVTVERSANGVKFGLRTYLTMPYAGLKAGIITPRAVIVRDLPNTPSPSATFITEDLDIDKLHFAVFDSTLVLYGAFCPPMWESNVLSILHSHDKKTSLLFSPSPVPRTLPKSSEYGDEKLASGNFYTPFDISARMPQVEAFLDGPRALSSALDGLSPRITPRLQSDDEAASDQAETKAVDVEPELEFAEEEEEQNVKTTAESEQARDHSTVETTDIDVAETNEKSEVTSEEGGATAETEEPAMSCDGTQEIAERQVDFEQSDESEQSNEREEQMQKNANDDTVETNAVADIDRDERVSEVAATEVERAEPKRMPWELESAYLSARGNRKPVRSAPRVAPVKTSDTVRKLRDMQFFEKCRSDIEKLFSSAPKDEKLCEILPDMEWVKAALGSGNVAVGRSGDAFLCYAVQGTYSQTGPFGEDAQWLPAQKQSPTGNGYWLIFQSLATGEIIRTT